MMNAPLLPRARLVILSFPLLLAACPPSTEDLSVSASIEDASLTVDKSPFGTAADPQGTPGGKFTLSMSLGELASSASDVTVQSFALVNAETQALLFPVQVQATATKVFRIEIATTQKFVYTLNYDKPIKIADLCAAKQVQFTGTILDGARGKTTPVTSTPITAQILNNACPGN